MNKSNKKILIYIVIVTVLIVGILLFIKYKNSNKVPDLGRPEEVALSEENSELYKIDSKVKRVSITSNYYYVKNSMNKFYALLAKNNIANNDINETQSYLYSLLGNEYIEEKGIKENNVLDYFSENNNAEYNIIDMYVSQRSFDISVYFIYGKVREDGKINDFSCMIIADRTNETFKFYPEEYLMNKFGKVEEGQDIEIRVPENIANDGYNTFKFKNITTDIHAEALFENLKNYLLYDNETLYNRLDEEYKSQFLDYQDFYNYISSNYLKLIKLKYNGYNKLNEADMNTTYTFKDLNGNFEFKLLETAPFYYKVIIQAK